MTEISFGPSSDDRMMIDNVEHHFPSSSTILERILSVITLILINTTNGGLIHVIKMKSKSALDWMMLMDSILCVLNSVVIIRQGIFVTTHPDNVPICVFFNFFDYFINICNRLVTIGIVVYRYVFVLQPQWVETNGRRQFFIRSLFSSIFITAATLTGFAIYFRDLYQDHLCNIILFTYCICFQIHPFNPIFDGLFSFTSSQVM